MIGYFAPLLVWNSNTHKAEFVRYFLQINEIAALNSHFFLGQFTVNTSPVFFMSKPIFVTFHPFSYFMNIMIK